MAFETSVLSGTETLTDIFDLLTTFATAEGWTIHTSTGIDFHASNGDCHVSLIGRTNVTVNDLYGSTADATSDDHRIEGRLRADATAYSTGDITGSNTRVVTNDWLGPYSNYWLFSGDVGDPPYIHLVVQKANGRFCHLSFGVVDKKGAVYDGGAFLTGVFWHWWFDSAVQNTNSAQGSDISSGDHLFYGLSNESNVFAGHNISMGDLDSDIIVANCSLVSYTHGKMTPLMGRQSGIRSLTNMPTTVSRWIGHFFYLGPNPLNGVTTLMEVPVMRYTENDRSYYLGSLPGIRYCSMIGRTEVEDVSFASDDYIIFPMKRALPWEPEPWSTRTVTSGPFGMAIKKIA